MSEISKVVDRNISSPERSVKFTNTDGGQGDIFLVEETLGRPARNIEIRASGGSVSVRFNHKQKIYQKRTRDALMFTETTPNTASGLTYYQTDTAEIIVEDGSTYTSNSLLPVKDVQMVTVSGLFEVTCA